MCVLAAAGNLTNRDIAQRLFVTEKTVELHLTSAYRKLGIRSRFQLAPALEPHRKPDGPRPQGANPGESPPGRPCLVRAPQGET